MQTLCSDETYHCTGESSKGSRPYGLPLAVRVAFPQGYSLIRRLLVETYLLHLPDIPASRAIPSLLASTQEMPHRPQTNLSFPSFTHPHLAAATASIAGGLLPYVVSLYVERRAKNDDVDEGR